MTDPSGHWCFLSNHAHVLVCVADDPSVRLRDIAERVGITERTTFRVITELEENGIVKRVKHGRRNHYVIDKAAHLRHPVESHCTVGELLDMILDGTKKEATGDS